MMSTCWWTANRPEPSDKRTRRRGRGVPSAVRRGLLALLLAALLPAAAAAYTVVMRGGRRVEVPAAFVVTQTTLTYEAAPGLNVTLQLAQIDVAATERANGESPGSLLRRAESVPAADATTEAAPRAATRTLTNRELEPARRARLANERAYEQQRRALGWPAPAEVKLRDEAELAALRRISRQREAEQSAAEAYWRARAADLRAQQVALDAELDYLNAQGAPAYGAPGFAGYVTNTYVVGAPFGPFYTGRGGAAGVTSSTFDTRTQLRAHVRLGGGVRARLSLNRQDLRGAYYGRGYGVAGGFFPGAVFAVPFNYQNADASALATRRAELEAARAGLAARWRLLADEARRAGAQPGWLRP